MIEQAFVDIPAKTACPGKARLIFNEIQRGTGISFLNDPFWFMAHISSLVHRINFILRILIVLNGLNN